MVHNFFFNFIYLLFISIIEVLFISSQLRQRDNQRKTSLVGTFEILWMDNSILTEPCACHLHLQIYMKGKNCSNKTELPNMVAVCK